MRDIKIEGCVKWLCKIVLLAFGHLYIVFFFYHHLENCGKTLFFNGQEDHLVPSTSRLLLDSDLFRVIGRMIGHSFLHGGPLLTGLSRSLFNLLIGQKDEIAVVELEDCPDTDVTDIVLLVSLNSASSIISWSCKG